MGAATCRVFAVLVIVAIASSSTILESHVEVTQFGSSLILNCTQECNDTNTDIVVKYWVIPDMTLVQPKIKSHNRNMELLNNGWSLHIKTVEREDLGNYLCLTASTNRRDYYHYTRVRVYKTEPETWQQFRTNVITGAIAAGACFVLIVFVCIIYSCRWRPAPGQSKSERMKRSLYDIEYSYEPESPVVVERF